MKVTNTHSALLALLKSKENAGESITVAEILHATNWKKSTFLTYLGKGIFSAFLNEQSTGTFAVSSVTPLGEDEFSRLLSQSKHRRELGHICKSRLAKALLQKSRDNMLLALELYNRPSLDNRMDGFVLCFCTAWEQLLKSMLIERHGENSIFKDKQKKKNRIRETISLRDCLNRWYENNNLIKKNIERIAYYRDQAVHLLMPEIQDPVSRLFQSGIMNYSSEFEGFAQQGFLDSSHTGLMTLVGDLRGPDTATLKSRYGNHVGAEVAQLADELADEAGKVNDIRFAIPIDVRLVFARDNADGQVIHLSNAGEGMDGLRNAIVVEKPVDRERTHPYRQKDAIRNINIRLNERYRPEDLLKALPGRDEKTGRPRVSSHDFQAGIAKLKWKSGNNRHHYKTSNPENHYYSEQAIDEFVGKVMEDESFLKKARESWRRRLRKRR